MNRKYTKLIIVEGIPGSGKTTTAQLISECVANQGYEPLLFLENAPYHPVDIDNLSYLDDIQYAKLLTEFSMYQSAINIMTEKSKNGYFLHYLKWFDLYNEDIPDDFMSFLMQYDAHDTLPPDIYQSLLTERWETFSTTSNHENSVFIFECCLFQNPMTVFIGKHNHNIADVNTYIYELAEYVRLMNPILVFLYGDNAQQTLKRVIKTRSQEWIDLVTHYVTGQGYGKAQNLHGLPGVFAFYSLLQEQMSIIASHLDWDKLLINHTNWEWELYHKQISEFIKRALPDKECA